MADIGQSHLLWRSRAPYHIYHSNTIVRIVPIKVGLYLFEVRQIQISPTSQLLAKR